MALTDKFRVQADKVAQVRKELAYQRAKAVADDVIRSEQFQLAMSGIENAEAAVDVILKNSVDAIFDPVATFLDTMRSKGLNEAYIRKCVHNIYDMLSMNTDGAVQTPTYEEMLSVVAQHMSEHPEMYNSIKDADAASIMQSCN